MCVPCLPSQCWSAMASVCRKTDCARAVSHPHKQNPHGEVTEDMGVSVLGRSHTAPCGESIITKKSRHRQGLGPGCWDTRHGIVPRLPGRPCQGVAPWQSRKKLRGCASGTAKHRGRCGFHDAEACCPPPLGGPLWFSNQEPSTGTHAGKGPSVEEPYLAVPRKNKKKTPLLEVAVKGTIA